MDKSESELFLSQTLPNVIRLALKLPEIIPNAIPLLKQNQNRSISLSQKQIACLLANAFLCTFPGRSGIYRSPAEFSTYPSINFSSLFQTFGNASLQNIRCICNYFRRICVESKLKMNRIFILYTHNTCSLIFNSYSAKWCGYILSSFNITIKLSKLEKMPNEFYKFIVACF